MMNGYRALGGGGGDSDKLRAALDLDRIVGYDDGVGSGAPGTTTDGVAWTLDKGAGHLDIERTSTGFGLADATTGAGYTVALLDAAVGNYRSIELTDYRITNSRAAKALLAYVDNDNMIYADTSGHRVRIIEIIGGSVTALASVDNAVGSALGDNTLQPIRLRAGINRADSASGRVYVYSMDAPQLGASAAPTQDWSAGKIGFGWLDYTSGQRVTALAVRGDGIS